VLVAGRHMLPHWYIDDPELPTVRPHEVVPCRAPDGIINGILRHCVVPARTACIATAGALLELVDATISMLEHGRTKYYDSTANALAASADRPYVFLPPDGDAFRRSRDRRGTG